MIKRYFLLLVFVLVSSVAIAQVAPPDDEDDAIPIDGGVTILLVAGAAYASKRILENK